MKKLIKNICLFASGALLLGACSQDNGFDNNEIAEGYGELSTAKMMLKIDNEEVSRATVDLSDFTVAVYQGTSLKSSFKYGSMPDVIVLPSGSYTVKVNSSNAGECAFDSPYYEGEEDFTIVPKKVTEVKTVVCKLANVRVSILLEQKLKEAMGPEDKVEVKVGNGQVLEFMRDETRSGYFAYQEGNTTLVATFKGTVEGIYQEKVETRQDVAPGTHFRINYAYHKGNGSDPEGGLGGQMISIDSSVEVDNLSGNVDGGSSEPEILTDDQRPQEGTGDDPNPDPNPGDDPTPANPAPTITARGDIDLSKVNNVNATSTVILDVVSQAEGGITKFEVDINSDKLTPDELVAVGLDSHLDLVNPANSTIEKGLTDLGLPCNVGGEKEITFDISSFMGLLGLLGSGYHEFKLTVGDANGETIATLKLQN